jgi:hypothetical protein
LSDEYLKITQHMNHAEVDVLRPCAIQWSTDTVTWYSVLSEVPAGVKFRDFDAPEDGPRNYAAMAIVDGRPSYFFYYHPAAARAFAEQMAPWFGGDEEKPRKKKKKIKSLKATS